MKTFEEWKNEFESWKYESNTYSNHPYGIMVVKPNRKEVICFSPIQNNGRVFDVIVNTHKVKEINNNTWLKLCCDVNYHESCIRHRLYPIRKAYELYVKYKSLYEKTNG